MEIPIMLRVSVFAALLVCCSQLWANGVLQQVQGEVKVGEQTAVSNQRVQPGQTISTGTNSRAVIKFADGHVIMLGSNSALKVDAYQFNKAAPKEDNIVLSFLRGALRSVSGALGGRNPDKFKLVTPTATAGIRGTDFILDLGKNGKLFAKVVDGSIQLTNAQGTLVLTVGQTGMVAGAGSAPALTNAALPAAMGELTSVTVQGGNLVLTGTSVAAAGSAGAAAISVAIPLTTLGAAVAGTVAVTSDDGTTAAGHHSATVHHITAVQ
jgi:hypothetical protein